MDLTRIVSGMDLMVVVEEDVKDEEGVMVMVMEAVMVMEVVEEEVVKVPLEELEGLEGLVVLARTDQIPTVFGKFLCLLIDNIFSGKKTRHDAVMKPINLFKLLTKPSRLVC